MAIKWLGTGNVVHTDATDTTTILESLSSTGATSISYAAGSTSVTVSQNDTVTNSVVGSTYTIQAQNATGTSTTGGKLSLLGGIGTTTGGAAELIGGAGQTNGNGGDIHVTGGTKAGSGKDGNIILNATSATMNSAGKVIFIASKTATPSAAPAGGSYLFHTNGLNLSVIDEGNQASDIHPFFKANQSVAFTPVSVAKYMRSGTGKFTSVTTQTIFSIEAALIPSGASQNCVGHAIIHVTALDPSLGSGGSGTYCATWRIAFKVISGTLSLENSGNGTIVGTAIDTTASAVAATAVTCSSFAGAINVSFTTLKSETIYCFMDAEIEIMRAT